MYGVTMNKRLTKSDWISQGLQTLATEGASGLKVGPMSTKLKVSRGSFYWHFADLADFHAQLLQSWEESSTERVIQGLDAREGDPDRLRELVEQGLKGRRRLDRAMRSWAAQDSVAAAVVASVDARRIAGLAKLLAEAGVDTDRAAHRATFLYWAYLGQSALTNASHSSLPATAVADIVRLFET
jgi:AcrR family transcriptional regulator